MLKSRLKILRMENELTQAEIADVLEISRNRYSQYETGKRTPDNQLLIEIADYYNVSLDFLHGRTEIRSVHRMNESELTSELVNAGVQYIEVDKYTRKYGLSKKQIRDLLEQAIILTQIAKDK